MHPLDKLPPSFADANATSLQEGGFLYVMFQEYFSQ